MVIVSNCIILKAIDFPEFYAILGGDSGFFGDVNTGLTVFPTLLVPSGGRYEGMGTAFTAVADDSSFLEANPSASSLLDHSELTVSHNNWIGDTSVEGLIYTMRFDELGIGFGGKFLYVPFTGYDEWAARDVAAYYSESVATLNLSYNFFSSYGFYGLALGSNIRIAYRSIPDSLLPSGYSSQSSLGVLADFGALTRFNFLKFYPSRTRNFSVGLVLKNLGPKVQSEQLPTRITAGLAISPIRPLTLSYDIDLPIHFGLTAEGLANSFESLTMAGGLEVVLTDFFSMQGGFNYRGANPGITLGAAVDLPQVSLVVNYTLDLATTFEPLDRISIQAKLNLGDRGRLALRLLVDELYLAGVEAYAAGDLDEAIAMWQETLELDSGFSPARKFLARAIAQRNNRDRLESVLVSAT